MSNARRLASFSNLLDSGTNDQVLTVDNTQPAKVKFAAGGTDSATVINLIDSDYVSARAGGGGGVTTYTNKTAIDNALSGAAEGVLAYVLDSDQLYVRTTSSWKRVGLGVDETPVIVTEPTTTMVINGNSTSTNTMLARDPEGFDLSYTIQYNTSNGARPSQLSSDTTINQTTGVYTFTTGSSTGSFKSRLGVSDGARQTTRLVSISIGDLIAAMAGDGTNLGGTGTAITRTTPDGAPSTVTDSTNLNYSMAQIDATDEIALFDLNNDFDLDAVGGSNRIVFCVKFDTIAGPKNGITLRDKDGATLTIIAEASRGITFIPNGTTRAYDTTPSLSADTYYMFAPSHTTTTGSWAMRVKSPSSSAFDLTISNDVGYAGPTLGSSYNNHIAFHGNGSAQNKPTPISDAFSNIRGNLDHKVVGVALYSSSKSADDCLTDFESTFFK